MGGESRLINLMRAQLLRLSLLQRPDYDLPSPLGRTPSLIKSFIRRADLLIEQMAAVLPHSKSLDANYPYLFVD